MGTLLKTVLIGIFAAALMWPALDPAHNMRVGVTDISRQVYDLHNTIFLICVVIGIVVFGVMFYAIFNHRKSLGAEPAKWHDSFWLEVGWTVVPFVILVVMAVPSTLVLRALYDTTDSDMTVEVRGYQWKWQYKYLDENNNPEVSFFSNLATSQDEIHNRTTKGEYYLLEVDKPLVIPIGKKVRFLLTANDVIHAWWVPDFGLKRDAVPGIINEMWTVVDKPGIYRGQCAELCGKNHGFMPVVVRAVPQDEYDAWYAEQIAEKARLAEILEKDWTAEELMQRGEGVYATYCASCHQANGGGLPPVFPSLIGSPVVTGDKAEHINTVYNGRLGTAMQAFSEQLNPVDMAAVIHYERHSWGNNSADVTLPKDILEFASRK